ncbi:hypothetical protein ACFY93_31425 [Streptomyces sp. NPDC008313]|uniref:hypothetical protein n=1 Tax=Streptomyces sp. NPDC008313 TaxID=3364826 RepID=UPI0036E6B56F
MTRSVDIDLEFQRVLDVGLTVRRLFRSGMNPLVHGEVCYLLNDDGLFDWRREQSPDLEGIVSELGQARRDDAMVGISLLFPDSQHGGDFLFHPGRTMISCVLSINPKLLSGSSRFCDIGWYLAHLIPIFAPLGLTEFEARDSM